MSYRVRLYLADPRIRTKVNHILRHHNRAAYSSQPLRHAAEQIYELYWDSGEPRFDDQGEEVMVMERGADLTDTSWVLLFAEGLL